MNVATQTTAASLAYDQVVDELVFARRQLKDALDDIAGLQELIRHLKRLRFAPSSEVYASGQGTLFNEAEALVEACGADSGEPDVGKPKKNRGRPVRRSLPATPAAYYQNPRPAGK